MLTFLNKIILSRIASSFADDKILEFPLDLKAEGWQWVREHGRVGQSRWLYCEGGKRWSWSTFAHTAVVIQRYNYVVQTSGSYKNVARRWCLAALGRPRIDFKNRVTHGIMSSFELDTAYKTRWINCDPGHTLIYLDVKTQWSVYPFIENWKSKL